MGWFWQETPASRPEVPPIPGPPYSPASAVPASKPTAIPEDVDPEIQKFLEMIQAEMSSSQSAQPAAKPSTSQPQPTSATPASSSWFSRGSTAPSPPPPSAPASRTRTDPVAEAALLSHLSCRDAFDYAWQCNTPGGQFAAVYRYGGLRSCSELWDDFWFCMRVRGRSLEERTALVRERARERDGRKYGPGKPSSEDVWESRTELARPGVEFTAPIGKPVEADGEWQLSQARRRREIRETMDFESRAS